MNIKLNKKQGIIATTLIIFLGLLASYIFFPAKEIRIQSNLVLYNSLQDINDFADLVIVGSTRKDFSEFKPTVTYNLDGRIEDFYTVTDVKVDKVYKGTFKKENVPVAQVAVTKSTLVKLKKDVIIDEHYSIMQTGKKYVLFLKKVENEDFYSIISVYQGKYNIDGLDTDEDKVSNKNPKYSSIKQEVKLLYK